MPRIHVTVTAATAQRLAMLAKVLDMPVSEAGALMLQRGLDGLAVWLREDGKYYSRPETMRETWLRMDRLEGREPPPIMPDPETMGLMKPPPPTPLVEPRPFEGNEGMACGVAS